IQYETAQSLFMSLRGIAQTVTSIKFHGTYTLPVDPMMCEKDRVQSTALEVWRTTGYHFCVLHHYPLQTGHKSLYCCCQDEDKKQKSRPSQKEGVKHCDTLGMKRFSCMSSLAVSCCYRQGNRIGQHTVSIKMCHLEAHIPYYDITMPLDAIQIIRDGLEWSAPSALVPKICTLYPHLAVSQVRFAWMKMSEILWKKETNQLTSARLLLAECHDIDVLDVTTLDGIEQLCWGMTAIAHWLSGKVVEIALKLMKHGICRGSSNMSIDNTNARNLKLYSMLGEYDNAGFPLSYCLLSTATSIEITPICKKVDSNSCDVD
ncbi:hypothetical protein EDD15DRAFT_2171139, partial [Pisolithus albus]